MTRIRHIAYRTADPDAMANFFAAAMGMTILQKRKNNAIDLTAARIKKIESPVAGQADILVVPDLEAGNMLAKSLTFLAGADAAGIVLGARVPIILTSRADSLMARQASCAVAMLIAHSRREHLEKVVT